MNKFNSVNELAKHYGVNSLSKLGRAFYKYSDCGVSLQFVTARKVYHYEDNEHGIQRDLPNVWANSVIAIKFSTIVEGFDAEFEATAITFPCTEEDIDNTVQYLEQAVDVFLEEAGEGN
jgi:hypothetical protein